jgi:hypothetical protein
LVNTGFVELGPTVNNAEVRLNYQPFNAMTGTSVGFYNGNTTKVGSVSNTGLGTFNAGVTTPAQLASTVATGTAPLSIASTTPVANLTTVPTTYNHSGTQQTATHLVQDSCTLGTDCAVTLTGSAVFTSSTSYTCSAEDQTAAAATKIVQARAPPSPSRERAPTPSAILCIGN